MTIPMGRAQLTCVITKQKQATKRGKLLTYFVQVVQIHGFLFVFRPNAHT